MSESLTRQGNARITSKRFQSYYSAPRSSKPKTLILATQTPLPLNLIFQPYLVVGIIGKMLVINEEIQTQDGTEIAADIRVLYFG